MNNIYQIITDKIIESLNQGIIPWQKPWVNGFQKNLVSKKAYQGVNQFLLSLTPFKSTYWLTYKQAQALGGNVRKGEKSTLAVFWKIVKKGEESEDGYAMLRYYNIFNLDQCDGIESPQDETIHAHTPIESCELIVSNMPQAPTIKHGETRAFYSPSEDYVNMPVKEKFAKSELYYSVLFHELTHATGHKNRLNRKGVEETASFGSETYSKEELIAELGAAFLSTHCGIERSTLENSTSYIQNWLKALKNDPKMIVQASGQAQKAVNFILGNTQENLES